MNRPVIGITSGISGVPVAEGILPSHYVGLGYARAVDEVGGLPLIMPAVEGHEEEDAVALIDLLDGLLLAGGTDIHPSSYGRRLDPNRTHDPDPARDRFELALVRRARERDIPILGICRGFQMLNVAYGGTLDQHRPHRVARPVPRDDLRVQEVTLRVERGTRAWDALRVDRLSVYCLHHQAVDEVGDGLTVSMQAEDGMIEGLEDPEARFVLGVLWHPEQMADRGLAIEVYRSLVEAARQRMTEGR